MNDIQYVVVDKQGKFLLFEPTALDVFDMENTTIPFLWDVGSFTVFNSETALEELYEAWGDVLDQTEVIPIPIRVTMLEDNVQNNVP